MKRRQPRPARAHAGQTIVLFALGSLVFLGALGLVLDAGFDFAQRRAMQNAADASALAGAHGIYADKTAAAIDDDVRDLAIRNGLPDRANLSCTFVDNAGTELGACGSFTTRPATATGVSVRVSETHRTFAIRVLGIGTSGTGATATAHVQAIPPSAFDPGGSPIIVCGYRTVLVGNDSDDEDEEDDDERLSILQTTGGGKALVVNGQAQINPDAVGRTFLIHGPQIATCNTQGNRFKGVNEQNKNNGKTVSADGTPLDYDPGVRAGPLREAVRAVNGCRPDSTGPCIMILPVADNVSVDCGNCQKINVVGFVAFEVSDASANSHTGKLLDRVVLQSAGTQTWVPGTPGMVTIRLTK
jgi:Flp pilus assembly protein TadG